MKVENNRDNSTNLRNRTPKPFKVNAIHKVKTDKKIRETTEVTNIRIKNDTMAINPTNILKVIKVL